MRWIRCVSGVVLVFAGFLLSCAKMGPPPGGPKDIRGPLVIETFPATDTTGVSRKLQARVWFDEAVNRRSVENAVFLSPDVGDRVQLSWRGRRMSIRYLDSLEQNRTYVITIGSGARDLRGNPIDRPFTLAFSTGDHIDQGRIWGQVVGEKTPQNVNLLAFVLSDSINPNPQESVPAYRTQPNAKGIFNFTHLSSGTYRVFALVDVGHDRFWNPLVDRIGIPPYDVEVTDESRPYLSFRLSLHDTSSIKIRGMSSKSERQLEVKFSKPILTQASFSIESLSGDTMPIFSSYENPEDSTSWQVFTTQPMASGQWKLEATIMKEDSLSAHILIDTVTVRAIPDTNRPEITRQFPKARDRLVDAPEILEFFFSEAVLLTDSIAKFELYRKQAEDTLELSPQWFHNAHLSLIPPEPLQRGEKYTVEYNALALSDLSGNTLGDTTVTFSFQVISDDSLGSLSGTLENPEGGFHVLSAFSLRQERVVRSVTSVPPGEFVIEELLAGDYLIEVLQDKDKSGDFSRGNMDPWQFSEPVWVSSDTFRVRARWDRGGIHLKFPVFQ